MFLKKYDGKVKNNINDSSGIRQVPEIMHHFGT
jgi:hypothetical protein